MTANRGWRIKADSFSAPIVRRGSGVWTVRGQKPSILRVWTSQLSL